MLQQVVTMSRGGACTKEGETYLLIGAQGRCEAGWRMPLS